MNCARSVVKGVGHYLPDRVVPNSEFESTLETSDEWIRSRTGIIQRHFAADGQTTSDLAIRAGRAALQDSGCGPEDIDLVILATTTPDYTFPSTATQVQSALQITNGFAFDMQAVCAGFVYAVATANALMKSGEAKCALVIGAETFSRILDMNDRSTCVLFGDGAGALVIKSEESVSDSNSRGILATDIHSDGQYLNLLYVDGGVSSTQTAGSVRMDGREIFRHAVEKLVDTTNRVLRKANVSCSEIDWIVPHQANLRIIRSTTKKLKIPSDKVIVTVDRHGNTSAASIPLALSKSKSDGRIKPGDTIVMKAIGGGLTWGSVLLRW